jgi:vacuolar-type H+-ATPase subunit E/Vma4
MSLEVILEAIRSAGEARLLEVEAHARAQAAEIQSETSRAAQQIQEKSRASAAAPTFQERARIIHRAHFEALKATGSTLEGLVDTTLDRVRQELAVIRMDDSYPTILRKLVQEALAELEGSPEEVGKVRLEADGRDRSLLENILQDLRLNLPVSYKLNCWGGLIAKSEDERVTVINTLEARLERATPFLRQSLASFFEAETNHVWLRVRERTFARQEIPLAIEAGVGKPGGNG